MFFRAWGYRLRVYGVRFKGFGFRITILLAGDQGAPNKHGAQSGFYSHPLIPLAFPKGSM